MRARINDADCAPEEIFARVAALERAVQALGNKLAALLPESTDTDDTDDADAQSPVPPRPHKTLSLFDEE
jgi:hypothetical protein